MMMWLTQAIGRQDNAFLEVGTVLSTSPLRVDAGGLIEDVWLCAPANTHTLPQQGDYVLITQADGAYICLGVLRRANLMTGGGTLNGSEAI